MCHYYLYGCLHENDRHVHPVSPVFFKERCLDIVSSFLQLFLAQYLIAAVRAKIWRRSTRLLGNS